MTYRTLTVHVRALAAISLALTALLAPATAQACERSDDETGLRAEGSALRWENAGQPRSAEVEANP